MPENNQQIHLTNSSYDILRVFRILMILMSISYLFQILAHFKMWNKNVIKVNLANFFVICEETEEETRTEQIS